MKKLFLEELKCIVESEVPLTEYRVERLQEEFGQSPFLIKQFYQLLLEKRHILPFIDDVEAAVYDYIVSREMAQAKTFYGATMFVAEMFGTTQTYVKCKVNQYRQPASLKPSA
ncbi:hypothetical protein ACFOU2_13590 [Bacillus songklensis]|uniref:Uncharacterized protein n=1 Tax=Bacillus songklensis TaxID=1069116 RepID=A0ABV8B3P4_9BACI